MIYEFDIAHAYLFGDVLAQMHRLRHEQYVVQAGWDVPTHDGMEFDQYDTLRARYLVGIDPADGKVRAAQRNLLCDGPYMMKELWPELVAPGRKMPADASWAEGTRVGIDQSLPPAAHDRWRNSLTLANLEWGLARGCTHITWVTYEYMVDKVLRPIGYPVELWGEPVAFRDGRYVAGYWKVTPELLANMRERMGIHRPQLVTLEETLAKGAQVAARA
ncbi:acyl-homoserine-lactone synthase [Pyruvatibacter mobilis]|uniref:acyl-homoserine-lactone synthase n=1 Tax=Pyruvatibacter mobilis TaxID=1712261 RepID=UPI003BA9D15E